MTLKKERNKENNRRGEAENLTKGDEQQSKEKQLVYVFVSIDRYARIKGIVCWNNGWLLRKVNLVCCLKEVKRCTGRVGFKGRRREQRSRR